MPNTEMPPTLSPEMSGPAHNQDYYHNAFIGRPTWEAVLPDTPLPKNRGLAPMLYFFATYSRL